MLWEVRVQDGRARASSANAQRHPPTSTQSYESHLTERPAVEDGHAAATETRGEGAASATRAMEGELASGTPSAGLPAGYASQQAAEQRMRQPILALAARTTVRDCETSAAARRDADAAFAFQPRPACHRNAYNQPSLCVSWRGGRTDRVPREVSRSQFSTSNEWRSFRAALVVGWAVGWGRAGVVLR